MRLCSRFFIAVALTLGIVSGALAWADGIHNPAANSVGNFEGIDSNKASGAALDPATTAWVNAVVTAGGTVSAGQQTNVNNLILALKGHSLFSKLDRMWLYASENATQAKIDIVNLATHTVSGTPTFTASQGYTGNGSAFINTNFIPSSSGVNYVLSSASAGVYVRNNRTASSNVCEIGVQGVTGNDQAVLQINAFTSNNIAAINDGGGLIVAGATTSQGFWVVDRTASNLSTLYNKGSSIGSGAIASNSLATIAFHALSLNNNAVDTQFSSDQIAVVLLGGALTSTDNTNLSTDVNGYMTALGTNVY